jgi:hypothetical protein
MAAAPEGYQFENAPAQQELASGTHKLKLKEME